MSKWSHNKPGHTQLTLQARVINVVTQPVNLQQFHLHARLISVVTQPTAIHFTYQTHQCNHTTHLADFLSTYTQFTLHTRHINIVTQHLADVLST